MNLLVVVLGVGAFRCGEIALCGGGDLGLEIGESIAHHFNDTINLN